VGYSFYEIYITSQRAFRAMGFPFGADEDAGFIIAWLELNHLNGIKILHNLLNSIDHKYDGIVKIENLNENIDFKNSTILMKGSGLVDYLQSISNQKEKLSLNIKNCPDGILFLPLLYKISRKNNYVELNFINSKNKISKYKIKDKEIAFETLINQDLLINNEVRIIIKNDKENLENLSQQKIITQKTIQDNLAQSINTNENLWKEISQIANKTFVPESEESRNKGAGGGDAND
jgi:hypothetical protein|tara:strand:+ start:83 stop:784 length:702 start_codon:yes stop_codon:yes gene_type:complete